MESVAARSNGMEKGVGLGLRDELIDDLLTGEHPQLDFLELAPENWMQLGGRKAIQLKNIANKYPLVAHGLSLSIGDTAPLNKSFIQQIKQFLSDYDIKIYSEHLSFGRDRKGYLYDLLPVPFYPENIAYLSKRILAVQELLGMRLALENISYYHHYPDNISEIEFITTLLKSADCDVLLDVNNVYVNSQNHGYDPYAFISALPPARVRYIHIAGHAKQTNNSILDTHGRAVSQKVWELLAHAYAHLGLRPTLLERDHFIPALSELKQELTHIHTLQTQSIPLRVAQAMDSFSDAIRARHAAQGSVALYQHLLSTSIGAIIRSCYTRFFQCLTIEYAQDLIGDFIHTHSCTRPMHHQLPTEFLQFIQTLTLPTGLKKIVEYEWLEWSAEICEVSPVSPIYPLPHITTQILMLSPAVSLVALPFDLDALSLDFVPIAGAQNYYRLIYTDKMLRVRHRAIQPYLARLIQVFQQTGVQKTVEQILDDFILECQNRLEKSFITQVLMGLYEEHILVIPPHSKGLK